MGEIGGTDAYPRPIVRGNTHARRGGKRAAGEGAADGGSKNSRSGKDVDNKRATTSEESEQQHAELEELVLERMWGSMRGTVHKGKRARRTMHMPKNSLRDFAASRGSRRKMPMDVRTVLQTVQRRHRTQGELPLRSVQSKRKVQEGL